MHRQQQPPNRPQAPVRTSSTSYGQIYKTPRLMTLDEFLDSYRLPRNILPGCLPPVEAMCKDKDWPSSSCLAICHGYKDERVPDPSDLWQWVTTSTHYSLISEPRCQPVYEITFKPSHGPDRPKGYMLRNGIKGVALSELASLRGLDKAHDVVQSSGWRGSTMVHLLTMPKNGVGWDVRAHYFNLQCVHMRSTVFGVASTICKDIYKYLREHDANPPTIIVHGAPMTLTMDNIRLVSLYSEDGLFWHSHLAICLPPPPSTGEPVMLGLGRN